MSEITQSHKPKPGFFRKLDKAWVLFALVLAGIGVFAPAEFWPSVLFAGQALAHTSVFILFAVLAVAYLKASGAEAVLARAFQGREVRMILMASVLGGTAPFCSCEVIPFIAALLAMGAPLSAVMAFWLSSPLMDPPMFLITTSALGLPFAVAKTISAVGLGLLGGFGVKLLGRTGVFANPLRENTALGGCGCGTSPFTGKPVWAFWTERARIAAFRDTALSNGLFLLKWLALAYVIEAAMIRFIPAQWIGSVLGGDGLQPVFLGALLGGPAYLNGYAAVPLLAGLIEQGMSQGAAMAFALAGGVSCVPAAIAVWALVKPRIFGFYLGFAFVGSLIAGFTWAAIQ